MSIPPILCVVGVSGSGKTHLLERVIPRLAAGGVRVAAVKHCGHVDGGPLHNDSHRLSRAGAAPAIADTGTDGEIRGAPRQVLLLDLVWAFCRDCDLVLAEGYSRSVHDKILLTSSKASGRPDVRRGRAPTYVGVRLVVGRRGVGQVGRDDTEAICRWIAGWLRHRRALREGVTAAVLTGGESRRMGRDKAGLRLAGRSMLGMLCERLADRLGQVMIIGRRPASADVPLCAEWHPDDSPGLGPLGGIATAVRVAAATKPPQAVCVVACDMPAVGSEVIDALLEARHPQAGAPKREGPQSRYSGFGDPPSRLGTPPATVMVNPTTRRVEPLLGIYEPHALAALQQALSRKRLSPTRWLLSAKAHCVRVGHKLARQFRDVDTPDDLARARQKR